MPDLEYANTACPYCAAALVPLPKAKKRCPACRQTIYVRVGPDALVYLLQDADRPILDLAWAEFRADQEWRRRAIELADEATVARTETEMRGADPRCTNRDVYWAVATRTVREHTRKGSWQAVEAACVRMALAAWDEAGSDVGGHEHSRPGSRSRARRLMREARIAQLRGLRSSPGTTSVAILADCCPACNRSANPARPLAEELTRPRLPHSHCQRGLCRCEYVVRSPGSPSTPRA